MFACLNGFDDYLHELLPPELTLPYICDHLIVKVQFVIANEFCVIALSTILSI